MATGTGERDHLRPSVDYGRFITLLDRQVRRFTAAPEQNAPGPQSVLGGSLARLFGTDGVRGLANRDVTAEMALDLAVAAAHVLREAADSDGRRPRAVVGRDPRASGEFLSAA